MTTVFIICLLLGAAVGMAAAIRICRSILERELDGFTHMLEEMEWSLNLDLEKRIDLTDGK